jgi:YD repeat-containing protein
MTSLTDSNGSFLDLAYNAQGLISTITDSNGMVTTYTYDPTNQLLLSVSNAELTQTYTYDAAGHVLTITNLAPDHTTVNSFDDYTYDALGNVRTDTNQDGQWRYTYDALDQLTQAVFTPNAADPDGLAAQNIQYVYDAAGNRISQTVNGVATTYTVNNLNKYTSSTTSGVTTTYQYDADGNLILQSNTASAEREGQRITADYQQLLGRGPEPGAVDFWLRQYQQEVSNENVVAGIVGSPANFQRLENNVVDWVFGAYEAILGRAPDDTGLAVWLTALGNG